MLVDETVETEQKILIDASDALSMTLDSETILQNLARALVPRLSDWCVIDVIEGQREIKRLAIAHFDESKEKWAKRFHGMYPPNPDAPRGIFAAIKSREAKLYPYIPESQLEEEARDDMHLRLLREFKVCSAMIVPLMSRSRVIGTITFANAESGRRFDARDLKFAKEIARRAALAADNARLYEDVRNANQLKDNFLATLSHELRTPLNPIVGWSELLVEGRLAEHDIAAAHECILRNARLQEQLVADLLDISRITAGKFQMTSRPVDLSAVIRQAVVSQKIAADAKDISFKLSLPPSLMILVAGDPDRLQQIVWNLLSNAIKFGRRGGEVTVTMQLQTNNEVEVEVSDNGEGIEPAFIPYVFDRFRQEDSTTTRRHAGLGLGLAIAKHLAELHGGALYAHSDGKTKGATFWLRLPVQALTDNHAT